MKEKLLEIVKKYPRTYNHIIKQKHPQLYQEILDYTRNIETNRFAERLYLYINQLREKPKCPVCGKVLKFININKGYQNYCSRKCAIQDTKERRWQTNFNENLSEGELIILNGYKGIYDAGNLVFEIRQKDFR